MCVLHIISLFLCFKMSTRVHYVNSLSWKVTLATEKHILKYFDNKTKNTNF